MTEPLTDHPAKYSESVLVQLRAIVRAEATRLARTPLVLDSFAGVGRIHQLRPDAHTVGVELEPEWAACHSETIVGDACDLPAAWTSHYDLYVSSPSYGNRLSDSHHANDKCKKCAGEGKVPSASGGALVVCSHCKGKGLSPRKNYRTALGRMPSEGSSCVLAWGDKYRDLHRRAIGIEAIRCVDDGGLIVVNISNHYRSRKLGDRYVSELQRVVEWYVEMLLGRGLYLEAVLPVQTKRMRQGANWRLRAGVEHIIVMRKPYRLEDDTP